MKLKLGALLVFSQAAAIAARGTPEANVEQLAVVSSKYGVNNRNYQEKMCGHDLFIVPERDSLGRVHDSNGNIAVKATGVERSITNKYETYCYSKSKYDNAVQDKKNGVGDQRYADIPITKYGIAVATVCEELKIQKERNSADFNLIFVDPKPCTPAPTNYRRPKGNS